jgi:capsule polysaccharide export protein KpsE/RkpR
MSNHETPKPEMLNPENSEAVGTARALDPSPTASATNNSDQGQPEPAQPEQGNAGIFPKAILLWSHRRRLTKAFAIGLAAGLALALVIPSRFESTVQLMPPDAQSTGSMAALAALATKSTTGVGSFAGDLLGVKSSGALFVGILRSRSLQDRIIARFHLKTVYGNRFDEDARKELAQNTGASEDRKSGIITLAVSDRDRWRAQAMAAAYVDELNGLVAELSTSAARRERVFLGERLVSIKQDLDRAARELGEFSSKNATVDINEQARAELQAAALLEGELVSAESQRQALGTIYTENNVRVRAAEARARELRRQLEMLGGKNEAAGTMAETGAAGEMAADAPYPALRRLPLLSAAYADLFRKAKLEETIYETLTEQYEIARVEEAKETPTVKILDAASMPERHSFPPRTLIALASGLMGMMASAAGLVARVRWQAMEEGDERKRFLKTVYHDVSRPGFGRGLGRGWRNVFGNPRAIPAGAQGNDGPEESSAETSEARGGEARSGEGR